MNCRHAEGIKLMTQKRVIERLIKSPNKKIEELINTEPLVLAGAVSGMKLIDSI